MIFRLAMKDVVHDWLLSICLVLAIGSIIAPLLVLFGLKYGTIETLRNRLIEDPKNREIRPLSSSSFTQEWIDTTQKENDEIVFIVPMTRQISTSVQVKHPSGTRTTLSLAPTGEGDPLLIENGVNIPGVRGCVMTEPAAKALQASMGDKVNVSVRRIIGGKTEKGEFSLTVDGILESRASSLKTIFVPLLILEAVEDFKDGRAVPSMGWGGTVPLAYPVYDGVALFLPEPLTKVEEVLLINNTGFAAVKPLTAQHARVQLGYHPNPEWSVYLVSVKKRPVQDDNISALRNKLRGKGAVIIPWIRPLPTVISEDDLSEPIQLDLLAISKDVQKVSVLSAEQMTAKLSVNVAGRQLSLPVDLLMEEDSQKRAFADSSIAGKLNLLRYRNVQYDEENGSLLLSRRGFAGFRLYTDSIDTVANVKQHLENQGIAVHTEDERIGEVKRLDKYLSLVFWLIAAVGVIGGISALTASLFASVERKKKELNVLRLLGLKTFELVRFPVFQGIILASAGVFLAGVVFMCVARLINHLFREHLSVQESLCTLSFNHFVILVCGVILLSVVSAVLAALQTIRLDPAEALRDE